MEKQNETLSKKDKEKIIFESSLKAFFSNESSKDRLLLTLSITMISGLIALFSHQKTEEDNFFIKINVVDLSFICAIVLFLITVGIVLCILHINRKILIETMKKRKFCDDKLAKILDKLKYWFFGLGVILAIMFSYFIFARILTIIPNKEQTISRSKNGDNDSELVKKAENSEISLESYDGLEEVNNDQVQKKEDKQDNEEE